MAHAGPAAPPPLPPAEAGSAATDGARHQPGARRFLLLLLGVNGAVLALAFGMGTLVPAAEAAGHAGGGFIAWCSTLR